MSDTLESSVNRLVGFFDQLLNFSYLILQRRMIVRMRRASRFVFFDLDLLSVLVDSEQVFTRDPLDGLEDTQIRILLPEKRERDDGYYYSLLM